jgi:hypothetical protein
MHLWELRRTLAHRVSLLDDFTSLSFADQG